MSKKKPRALAAGGAVALSAATGIATNFLTERLSWALGAVVVVLVIAGVALAVANSMAEHRTDDPVESRPQPRDPEQPAVGQPPVPQPGGVAQHAAGDRTTQAGRDVHTGMPAGYVVLCLVVVAAAAVAVLLVSLRFAPAPAADSAPRDTPSVPVSPTGSPEPQDLRYDVSAARSRPREVRVKVTAHGLPEPGLTYWFFVEVDYGKGYVEFYPRRKLTGRSTSFDIILRSDADLRYPRTGRIYGLTGPQNSEADVRLQRQETTAKNDYFVKAPGQPASEPVKMPF